MKRLELKKKKEQAFYINTKGQLRIDTGEDCKGIFSNIESAVRYLSEQKSNLTPNATSNSNSDEKVNW